MFEQIAYVLEMNPRGISIQVCLKGGHCVGAGCRPPDGSQEILGSSMGGAREAPGRPLRGSRRLLGASREAPGRLLGATKRNPETSEEPKEGPGPHGTPKNPPRTPPEPLQKPSLESRVRADLRPRRTQEGASSTTGALKGVFKNLHGASTGSTFLMIPCCCIDPTDASVRLRQARNGVKCRSPSRAPGTQAETSQTAKTGPLPPPPPPRSRPR